MKLNKISALILISFAGLSRASTSSTPIDSDIPASDSGYLFSKASSTDNGPNGSGGNSQTDSDSDGSNDSNNDGSGHGGGDGGNGGDDGDGNGGGNSDGGGDGSS